MKIGLKELSLEFGTAIDATKKQSEAAIRELVTVLSDNLVAGHEINIPDFGKFRVKETKARKGKNPATGEEIDIPAKRKITFTPAKKLKEAVGG